MTSVNVMSVLGPVAVDTLGITLMHEHILLDASNWWHCPSCAERMKIAEQKIAMPMLGELRMDPFLNKDNCQLDDSELAVAELGQFKRLGGATVVDPTNVGIGRNPQALADISRKTGLHIVMGAGFYLEPSHPQRVKTMDVVAIAEEISSEAAEGVADSGIRIGIIGEIGISAGFTTAEEKVLRGAARAAARSRLPLSVHLPGWERHAHRVLDIAESEGCGPQQVVLCHMNPSFFDKAYQRDLAERGAFLEYDMIGMDFFYADQQAQCPYDEDNARAICELIEDGYLERLLLSQDVFLKMMLTCYGGFGYAYILRHFVPRLQRHGVSDTQIRTLLVDNPRRVFTAPHNF
jgi:phosphotriesterase-related protein